jgi:ankyrin repeat protein
MKSSEQNKTIFDYIEEGDLQKVAKLIEAENSQLNVVNKDKDRQTPLHFAIENEKTEIALRLIELGADVRAKDNDGHTPLHFVGIGGNTEIFLKLIKKGADVNAKNSQKCTPLHIALINGKTEMALELIKKGADFDVVSWNFETPLHIAIGNGNTEMALKLIGLKPIDARDDLGETPLHIAARHGNTEIFLKLIGLGANLDVKGKYGQTPLHIAIGRETEIALKLIELGADVNERDESGNTALLIAAKHGNTKIALKLIELGAYIDPKNKYGETLLLIIAARGKTELLKALIELDKFDLSAVDNQGNSIFTYYRDSTEIIDLLLSRGADTELYEKEYKKTNIYYGLETISKSRQSAHYDEIPSEEEDANADDKISLVELNSVIFLTNFAKKYKDTWNELEDFQKAQALRGYFCHVLKGDDDKVSLEALSCKVKCVDSQNLFNEQNIAKFKGGLKYIEIHRLFKKCLGEISENLEDSLSYYFAMEKSALPNQDIQDSNNENIKNELLNKTKVGSSLYNKIEGLPSKDIAKIVNGRDLNDEGILLSVLHGIDEGKSFEDQIVTSSDLYVRFIKDEAFDQQQQMGIPQQSWINQPNDDEVEMINTSSQPMHLAGGHNEHIHDQHQ